MDKKLGLYICSGCSIGDSVDVDKLAILAQKEYKPAICQTHAFLCGDEGTAIIRRDLERGNVDAVVIAACSPRVKAESFSFDPRMVVERVNLREHVAWSHEAKHEDTQALAEDYIRMGLVKAGKMEALEALPEDTISRSRAGGGRRHRRHQCGAGRGGCRIRRCAGRKTAAARRIHERPQAGIPDARSLYGSIGRRTHRQARSGALEPAHKSVLLDQDREDRRPARNVRGNHRESAKRFESTGNSVQRVGAIIMATGWQPYDAAKLGALGYGLPNVITNVELEQMAARGPIARPSDGKPAKRVLFLQCAGSREQDHLAYCSSVCCMTTLKQTEYLRQQDPEAEVFVIYRDIVTPGPYEKYYRKVQDHPLNFFMKGKVSQVAAAADGRVAGEPRQRIAGRADAGDGRLSGAGNRHGAKFRRWSGHSRLA